MSSCATWRAIGMVPYTSSASDSLLQAREDDGESFGSNDVPLEVGDGIIRSEQRTADL
jgi:hypothetical protein